jgi:hypothetical protein
MPQAAAQHIIAIDTGFIGDFRYNVRFRHIVVFLNSLLLGFFKRAANIGRFFEFQTVLLLKVRFPSKREVSC